MVPHNTTSVEDQIKLHHFDHSVCYESAFFVYFNVSGSIYRCSSKTKLSFKRNKPHLLNVITMGKQIISPGGLY